MKETQRKKKTLNTQTSQLLTYASLERRLENKQHVAGMELCCLILFGKAFSHHGDQGNEHFVVTWLKVNRMGLPWTALPTDSTSHFPAAIY